MNERVTYSDIYDPAENPGHIGHRWIYDNGQLPDGTPITYERFAHYEGYGGNSSEKSTFIRSINRDHPLWSRESEGSVEVPVVKSDSYNKSLKFSEDAQVKVVGEEEIFKEKIDTEDRQNRTSWNFSLMLSEFVEKCSKEKKLSFFKENGYGRKWTKNGEMMKDFKRIFDWIDHMKTIDENKKISLSDQVVKNYPKHYYDHIASLYTVYMDEKFGFEWWKKEIVNEVAKKEEKKSFKFNPNASVFVPSVIFSPALEKGFPPKPVGSAPTKARPHSKDRPDYLLPWKICEESDKKILELDRKLQMLINLHGPVVEAEQI